MTLRRGCLFLAGAFGLLVIAVFAWAAWQSSDASLPPLAKGLSRTFKTGEQQLNQRLKTLYPVGSSERRLIVDLEAQGFTISTGDDGLSEANVRRFIGCGDKIVSIRWHARAGIITRILGIYGAVCL